QGGRSGCRFCGPAPSSSSSFSSSSSIPPLGFADEHEHEHDWVHGAHARLWNRVGSPMNLLYSAIQKVSEFPLTRPSGTLSPIGGEGRGVGPVAGSRARRKRR